MKNIIEINNLCKTFGELKAVQDLTLSVREGELFAFLGINGAGKSTTINIMCGQISKDSGEIIIDGYNLDESLDLVKNEIGIVFQSSVLDASLSVYDNLESRAALYGITGTDYNKRLDELADILEFKDILNKTVRNLSGGQRRRIDIARALIHKPKILILDEPTTGLDPKTRKLLWNVISNFRKNENMTIFLTTHYMEESVESDYIVIIDNGRIISEGTPHDLKNTYTQDYITIYGVNEDDIRKLSPNYEVVKNGYRISISNTKEATDMIQRGEWMTYSWQLLGKILKGVSENEYLH